MNWRLWALLAAVLIVFRMPAIPQSDAYHTFSDNRTLLGIPNCLDVVSNVFFLFVWPRLLPVLPVGALLAAPAYRSRFCSGRLDL